MPENDSAWLAYYLPRAEAGDAEAQIAIGWEYVRGEELSRDIETAIDWFRKASATKGELAIWQVFRLFNIENDPRMDDLYKERDWSLGAIHFTYGHYRRRHGASLDEQAVIFGRAADAGHFPGTLKQIQLSNPGFLRLLSFPRELLIVGRILWIWWRSPDDHRVLL